MSWSISAYLKPEKGQYLKIEDIKALVPVGNEQCPEERDEQVMAAKHAVYNIVNNAGFENAEEITVTMSGHANKDHKKDPAWANEFISISISIKSYHE